MARQLGAESFLPPSHNIERLREASLACRGCGLHRDATQTVFGEGRAHSSLMVVGEQPGNEEDLAGSPFVGPAGRVLDEALSAADIARSDVYLTNAVKHFKFERRGKLRLHKKPSESEIRACQPWLRVEIATVRPQLIVCLGATAAQSLIGAQHRVMRGNGKVQRIPNGASLMTTVHPSSVLRMRDAGARRQQRELLVADLRIAQRFLRGLAATG